MTIAYYPDFRSIEEADACSQQLYRLGRPYSIAPNDVGARLFPSIRLPDGRGAIKLDLNHEVVIHKDGIGYSDPLGAGTVGVLLKNFAGQPEQEELAGWLQVIAVLQALPDRGDPALNGEEPVIRIRLGDMLPASAEAALLTQEQVDALFHPEPDE
ncbi:MAG: hypothetical protein HC888_12330 [Candidatus Competibacteraceae bacterium]|nr:hypothetical protein [Candidatus Competibacteraceae bacterium]